LDEKRKAKWKAAGINVQSITPELAEEWGTLISPGPRPGQSMESLTEAAEKLLHEIIDCEKGMYEISECTGRWMSEDGIPEYDEMMAELWFDILEGHVSKKRYDELIEGDCVTTEEYELFRKLFVKAALAGEICEETIPCYGIIKIKANEGRNGFALILNSSQFAPDFYELAGVFRTIKDAQNQMSAAGGMWKQE